MQRVYFTECIYGAHGGCSGLPTGLFGCYLVYTDMGMPLEQLGRMSQ